MASVTMIASLGNATAASVRPRSLVMAKASARAEEQEMAKPNVVAMEEKMNSRRAAMFAAAAVAVSAVSQGIAMADEPKRGTPEARKAYAPVCVTMPTARICHKIA